MLKMYEKTYELWRADNNEILVDNLSFDGAAEQSKIYADFFGVEVVLVYREHTKILTRPETNTEAFNTVWHDYFEELQAIGNIN